VAPMTTCLLLACIYSCSHLSNSHQCFLLCVHVTAILLVAQGPNSEPLTLADQPSKFNSNTERIPCASSPSPFSLFPAHSPDQISSPSSHPAPVKTEVLTMLKKTLSSSFVAFCPLCQLLFCLLFKQWWI
jgi:hypothetical protein